MMPRLSSGIRNVLLCSHHQEHPRVFSCQRLYSSYRISYLYIRRVGVWCVHWGNPAKPSSLKRTGVSEWLHPPRRHGPACRAWAAWTEGSHPGALRGFEEVALQAWPRWGHCLLQLTLLRNFSSTPWHAVLQLCLDLTHCWRVPADSPPTLGSLCCSSGLSRVEPYLDAVRCLGTALSPPFWAV